MFNFFKNRTACKDDIVLSQRTVEEQDSFNNDEELVSVIAAAIAASMGVGIPEINIKSIRRVPQYVSPWNRMGKIEQLFGKF